MYGMRPVKLKVDFLQNSYLVGLSWDPEKSKRSSLNAVLIQAVVFQAPHVSYSSMLGVIFMLGVIKLNKW